MALHVGDLAPDSTTLPAARLPSLRDRWTVLYFYPLGNNPHCVMQSRRFQALLPQFDALGVGVVGVSVDSEDDQRSFRSLCAVSFPLVSDAQHDISRAYDVLGLEVDGKTYTLARRETFLIDPQGRVAHHWTQVDPNMHAQEVLDHLRETLGVAG